MRPLIGSLIFFVCALHSVKATTELHTIRKQFHQTIQHPIESERVIDFHQYLQKFPENDPVIMAYKAVSEALMAQTVWNPFEKLIKVNRFQELITQAVLENPDNIEIRFLRLSVEYHLPRILGMSTNIYVDRDHILNQLEHIEDLQLDPSFTRYILYFIKDIGICDAEQLTLIEGTLSKS